MTSDIRLEPKKRLNFFHFKRSELALKVVNVMKRIYYGWIIVGIGLLIKMAGLGFGRFAYAMLLPT